MAETTQELFSDRISSAMNEVGMTIRGLAQVLGMTYEHARKLTKGEALPSGIVLRAICAELNLDPHEMEMLSTASRIRKKYGKIPMELAGKNPELEPIELAWDHLTAEQKKDATSMIQGWAKRNKAMGA
jgi:transcriptional regulator with XRE-family HTH domain